ncbi:MAG: carbohydrate ABC transporter permease [Candidatus Hydrogenedentes bacterium]|nr:carbohydrate ABC transporter permease [Candidatus Hydrogenedentota bacterium]
MTTESAAITGSMTVTRRVERALGYLTLLFLAFLFMVPFFITLSDSLKNFLEIWHLPRIWIPKHPRWSNFVDIFTVLPFHQFFINTFCITLLALFGQVTSACFVAYSFARMRWPLRDFAFIVLLSTLMLPGQVTMIPVFLMFNKLGWVNTWLPLIVPAYFGGGVFNIFLLREFFKTIPLALEDAAKMDGCSHLRILSTIMVPLSKPALTTICVLGFIAHWNEFMGPLIYLSDYSKYPISLGIRMFKDAETMDPHYVMAASLVALVPVLILFFSAQRYFVQGIVLSGIKG